MSTETPVVYADDPDAHWTFTVTDNEGGDIDWTPVEVAVGAGGYTVTAQWLDDPAATRRVKVPMADLEPLPQVGHTYTFYLKVPGDNDVKLGRVAVKTRT